MNAFGSGLSTRTVEASLHANEKRQSSHVNLWGVEGGPDSERNTWSDDPSYLSKKRISSEGKDTAVMTKNTARNRGCQ